MSSFDTPDIHCPACGYLSDATTGVGHNQAPTDGAVTLCLACGALGFYEHVLGRLTIRPATAAEHDELIQDPQIRQVLAVRARTVGTDLLPPKGPHS